ncbi:unannotated protein [freshwater metagenome]|uniref:Unannotated protein n=1 Tax=freshwater metagenome TaxID=449393 RepID=A0A6J7L368_9ZZZZ|nr:methyltransferase domain-containing protein [Actinomycetota bacterium]
MTAGPFSDPAAVASYVEGPPRAVPGFAAAHALVDGLLAETVPDDGRVLVVGAGGGLELAHLAARHDGWRFDGVDPSAAMLRLARTTLGPLASRIELHEGYAADAPEGPFDGATCLLTLHFVPVADRVPTLREIRRRLRPGAPLLTLHHSVPGGDARRTWLERSVRFATGPGAPAEQVARSAATMDERLALCTPEEDERLLRDAGFTRVAQYFGALTFRGWIAHA